MRAILAVLDRISEALSLLAGFAVLILAGLIGYDIVARKLFGLSVQGTDELGGYTLALVGSLGMAHVLARREFTRIDLAFRYLPAAARRVLHALAHLALAGVVLFFAWHAWLTLDETLLFSTRANTPLQTPLWIPQGLWAFGMAFFALNAVIHALRSAVLLVAAPGRVEAEYGCSGIQEEVDTALAAQEGRA